jgi:4-amino-4-deoxy-L-arabinose transferase-like glycosyltransferase
MAILVVATLAYGLGMAREGLWYDEAYSAAMAEHPVPEIVRLAGSDVHPPLYYLLLHYVRAGLGPSEWVLRLPSLLGMVALVGLGAGPVRRIFGEGVSYLYAAVALVTPALLIYAHEVRMYSLVMLAVCASVLYGFLAARDNLKRDWVVLGLSSTAAAYLHYYGAIAVFYLYLSLGLWLLARRAKTLKPLLITGGCVALAYLPWLIVLLGQARDVRKGFWIPPLDIRMALAGWFVPFAYKDFHPKDPASMVAAGFIALAVVVGGAILAVIRKARTPWTVIALDTAVFLGTLLTGIVASLVVAPAFFPRYMVACTGLVVVSLALGISLLPSRTLQVAAVALLALANLPVIVNTHCRQFNGQMKELARDFRDQVKPGDLIITVDSLAMGPSTYYFPDACHCFCAGPKEASWQQAFRVFEPRLVYRDRLADLLSSRTTFWLVKSNWQYSANLTEILKESQGDWRPVAPPKKYASDYSRFAFSISQYVRVPPTVPAP